VSVGVEPDLVFNVVWTGTAFTYLRYFVASQIAQSQARFRFVVNGCPPEQVALMEEMSRRHPDRIVEVLEVRDEMGAHGVALEAVRNQRDDGELFGLIDPDIKANAPFVPELAALLEEPCVAVSSATEVWSDTNAVPPGHPGVAGEHFFGEDGFVFGGPHLTLYRRDALDETCERWGVHLGSAGPELPEAAQARLTELLGRRFIVFDTGKIVNALLQADGGTVIHQDLPQIVHIGGMSHYLAPAQYITVEDGTEQPHWVDAPIVRDRYLVTRYTAGVLRALCDAERTPEVPDGVGPAMEAKMLTVRDEITDLIDTYRDW